MQIVSTTDNLHELSLAVFWGKKQHMTSMSSAEVAKIVVEVKKVQLIFSRSLGCQTTTKLLHFFLNLQ